MLFKISNREFRKIPSLKFLYEISEDGRIFRNVKSKKQNKIIVDYHHSPSGYCFTWICRDGKVQRIPIARVVAECWLGQKPEGYEIDHIDRDSQNNHYTNLRYVTKSEQMKNRDHSNISRRGSENLRLSCLKRMKPVIIIDDNKQLYFESKHSASIWLAKKTGYDAEGIRNKLKQSRSHILGYDVIYPNVETACTRSTEQGTVQKMYLSGSTDTWNDAKKAEESERVKHL